MSHEATVNAGDIARLVDVGRAAVSNWRRRYGDFPRPVGGTASSPLFALADVEEWLRRNGKSFEVSTVDRVWQRVRAAGDDLDLGLRIVQAGEILRRLQCGDDPGSEDPELIRLLTEAAAQLGHSDAFEAVCERYLDAHSRQLDVTPAELASLMVRLADAEVLLDPACGIGTLLLASSANRVLGQDGNETSARIAELRLLSTGIPAEIHGADALRHDGFTGRLADAVVCDPPFNERSWGYDELTGDPRWEYGLPPRGEPELAWVQHCLAHVKPGGLVAILMPPAVASRRPGKRIRGNLLRAGALRAVITVSAGGPDLWLLRRPESGERPPAHLLLMEAHGDLSAVEPAWREHLRDPEPGVRIIDLLDDDVDLNPSRQKQRGEDVGQAFSLALERFRADPPTLPGLVEAEERPSMTTVGELVKTGAITILHAPAKPVVEVGDVVTSPLGGARVALAGGEVLAASHTLYRVDRSRLDPFFLAGCLRGAEPRATTASSRIDPRRTRVPRLALAGQRRYGEAFRRLIAMEDALRETAELGEEVVRLGFAGLVSGRLRPPS
jgi:hypothetical protein